MSKQLMMKPMIRALTLSAVMIFLAAGWSWGKNDGKSDGQVTAQADSAPATALAEGRDSLNIFSKLAKMVVPAVVNISTEYRPEQLNGGQGGDSRRDPRQDLFRRQFEEFFGLNRPGQGGLGGSPFQEQTSPGTALGSGVVIEVNGREAIILTNNHVIDHATTVNVQFNKDIDGGKSIPAKIIGRDPDLDLALLEVAVKPDWNVTALTLGDSDKLEVGEYVMAVGNPFGQGHSATHGIISAKDRSAPIVGKYLQTDAPINPGNSGGPLVNLNGEIIGINNAILAQAQGIGFAIPSNSIKNVLPELKKTGKVVRGYIGIMMGEVSPEAAAFAGNSVKAGQPFVMNIEKDSPAELGGMKRNDVIVAVGGKEVDSPSDLKLAIASLPIDHTVKLKILRNGQTQVLDVQIGKRKA